MKLLELRIKNYLQFSDTRLDFTDKNGNPAEKICFVGRNGTGKSTILRLIDSLPTVLLNQSLLDTSLGNFLIKMRIWYGDIYYLYTPYCSKKDFFSETIGNVPNSLEDLLDCKNHDELEIKLNKYKSYIIRDDLKEDIIQYLELRDNSSDLIIYSPSESSQNSYMSVNDVPDTTLNSAVELFNNFPCHHTVSANNIKDFWNVLIYLIKKRESEREEFENRQENLNKTKRVLIEEFDRLSPKILDKLALLWNRILGQAGLEFDVESASNPIQLNDNLRAYIRLKSNKNRINYNLLSTGIRNFIFRLGHIYALYFNREVERGFLLIDEPENSLFPDFLFDLVETYQEVLLDRNNENNTQFFVSTHNPIIAAQFEPYERIILEWNEEGFVDAFKGEAPVGDDPNDLLLRDFKLKNLMGKRGQEMWDRYISLRKRLRCSTNDHEKTSLISEINRIGELYNFES